MNLVSIKLSKEDRSIISMCLMQYYGGTWEVMESITGLKDTDAEFLEKIFDSREWTNEEVSLGEKQWRMIYDSINAVLYALGPSEVEMIVGYGPLQLLQTNLTICSKVWNAVGNSKWTEHYHVVPVAHTTLHS